MKNKSIIIFLITSLSVYITISVFRFSLGIVIPSMEAEFNISTLYQGLLISTNLIGALIISLFTGTISDKINIDRTIILGTLLMSTAYLLIGYANSYIIIIILVFVTGVGMGILVPSVYSKMGTILPKHRGLLIGISNTIFTIGGFIGSITTALIITSSNWRTPFLLYGIYGLIVLILLASTYRYIIKNKEYKININKKYGSQILSRYKEISKIKNIIPITGNMFIGNLSFVTFIAFAPSYFIEIQKLDIIYIGYIMAAFSISGGLSAILTGRLSDKIGRKNISTIMNVIALIASGIIFMNLFTNEILIILAAVFGFGLFPFWNLQISLIQDAVENRIIVTATAYVQNTAWIGAIVGPALTGYLLLFSSFQYTMLILTSVVWIIPIVLNLISRK